MWWLLKSTDVMARSVELPPRAPASQSGGRGFEPQPRHTHKMLWELLLPYLAFNTWKGQSNVDLAAGPTIHWAKRIFIFINKICLEWTSLSSSSSSISIIIIIIIIITLCIYYIPCIHICHGFFNWVQLLFCHWEFYIDMKCFFILKKNLFLKYTVLVGIT